MDQRGGPGDPTPLIALAGSLLGKWFGVIVVLIGLNWLLGNVRAVRYGMWNFGEFKAGLRKLALWGLLLMVSAILHASWGLPAVDPYLHWMGDYLVFYLVLVKLISVLRNINAIAMFEGMPLPGILRAVSFLERGGGVKHALAEHSAAAALIPTCHREGDVLYLSGDLSLGTAEELQQEGEVALRQEGRLILDLGQVTFMNSVGLGMLVYLHRLGRKEGWEVALRNIPPGRVQHMLDVVGATKVVRVDRPPETTVTVKTETTTTTATASTTTKEAT